MAGIPRREPGGPRRATFGHCGVARTATTLDGIHTDRRRTALVTGMDETREVIEELLRDRRAVVVGVGNVLRADDGIGPMVAARLAALAPGRVVDAGSAPEDHVAHILARRPELVLFLSTADHGGPPGSCVVAPLADLAPRLPSCHGPSLWLLAGMLESEGARCWLAGVQPRSLVAGAPMSDEALAAATELADAVRAVLLREAVDA
jgi:hydrogenase 3 maturation protease